MTGLTKEFGCLPISRLNALGVLELISPYFYEKSFELSLTEMTGLEDSLGVSPLVILESFLARWLRR